MTEANKTTLPLVFGSTEGLGSTAAVAIQRADYSWPLGMPTHEWMRAIPAPANSSYRCLYVEAKPHARGAFPTTYVREAWGEDSYEVLVAPTSYYAFPPGPLRPHHQEY